MARRLVAGLRRNPARSRPTAVFARCALAGVAVAALVGQGGTVAPAAVSAALAAQHRPMVAAAAHTAHGLRQAAPSGTGRTVGTGRVGSVMRSASGTPVVGGGSVSHASDGSVGRPVYYGRWGAGYIADAPPGRRAATATFVVPVHAPPAPAHGVAWAGIGVHALHGSELMQAGGT